MWVIYQTGTNIVKAMFNNELKARVYHWKHGGELFYKR